MRMNIMLLCAAMIIMIFGAVGCHEVPGLFPGENINLRVAATLNNTAYYANETVGITIYSYLDEYQTPIETEVKIQVTGDDGDQSAMGRQVTLQPGENTLTESWGPFDNSMVDNYTLQFMIDPDNQITESNEDDNTYTTRAEIRPKYVPCQGVICSPLGQTECTGVGYRTCGDYDYDNCLEWSSETPCPADKPICWQIGTSDNATCAAYVGPVCHDTDVGSYGQSINYTLRGEACNNTGCVNDTCVSPTELLEYYCYGVQPVMKSILYTCPNGCSAGACTSPPITSCTDTDGGRNYNKTGTTCVGATNCATDYCQNTYLYEMYCSAGGSRSAYPYTCPLGCVAGKCQNLRAYPQMFAAANGSLDGVAVVGHNAPSSDVIAAIDILSSLSRYGLANSGAALLDTEIRNITAQNIISIGSACDNMVTANLMGNPDDCLMNLTLGTGRIKLISHATGKTSILVMGSDAIDLRKAARVMSNFYDYLVFDAVNVCVTGATIDALVASNCQ